MKTRNEIVDRRRKILKGLGLFLIIPGVIGVILYCTIDSYERSMTFWVESFGLLSAALAFFGYKIIHFVHQIEEEDEERFKELSNQVHTR